MQKDKYKVAVNHASTVMMATSEPSAGGGDAKDGSSASAPKPKKDIRSFFMKVEEAEQSPRLILADISSYYA